MSRIIQLTQGKVAIVDDEDFRELNKHKWCAIKSRRVFYAARRANPTGGGMIYMHRVIHKTPNEHYTDHINGNGLDNQKKNLRTCTTSQNGMNRGIQKNNVTGYKGVCWKKRDKKYEAKVMFKRRYVYLGYFNSKHDAALAYNKKAVELHGEFAKLNEIERGECNG